MPALALGLAEGGDHYAPHPRHAGRGAAHRLCAHRAAKGLADGGVVIDYALRNALLPILTMIGMQFGSLFGGAVIIENVFARQGIGTLVTQAVINRDFPVVQSCVLVAAALYVLVKSGPTVLYAVIDPRIKYS